MRRRKLTSDDYDFDYFERGIESCKSLYEGYHFDKKITPKDVKTIIKFAELGEGDSILDFGCAKGIHVKAFRKMGYDCWGCDISKYAIKSADKRTKPYLRLNVDAIIPYERYFDCIIFKDVLEHLTEKQAKGVLANASKICQKLFAAIPLGDGKTFLTPDYNRDVTHILPRSKKWWMKTFADRGWIIVNHSHILPGIKDDWAKFKNGDLFIYGISKKYDLSK